MLLLCFYCTGEVNRMEIVRTVDYDEMSQVACQLTINRMKQYGRPVLGLATGSTPEGLYRCLIDHYKKGHLSFENVMTFNLDEYIGLAEDNKNSYHYYMNEKLFDHINLSKENAYVPNGISECFDTECKRYEQLIKDAGGIDIQLLGLGINGHIGFNEPGTRLDSRTHVVTLEESTRNANAHFFASEGEVPKRAISMGVETIMESKEIILLVSGEKKARALKRLVTGEISEEFPASILQQHENVTIVADETAVSLMNDY